MLWAIDVGNTNTSVGRWDGDWLDVRRLHTNPATTEDELAALLSPSGNAELIIASVNPAVNPSWQRFARQHLGGEAVFLNGGDKVGLEVLYEPPSAVGADRIANALGALEIDSPPIVVVDFGTATTLDAIDAQGRYVGGAIMAGVETSRHALVQRAAKLPQFEIATPASAIGKTVGDSLRSGLVFGTAGAVDSLVRRIEKELGGGCTVIATGGLGGAFADECVTIGSYQPMLTLEGLRIAYERIR